MLTSRHSHMEMNSNIEKLKHSEEDHSRVTNAQRLRIDNSAEQFCKDLERELLHAEEDLNGRTNIEGDIIDSTLDQFCKELETNLLHEKEDPSQASNAEKEGTHDSLDQFCKELEEDLVDVQEDTSRLTNAVGDMKRRKWSEAEALGLINIRANLIVSAQQEQMNKESKEIRVSWKQVAEALGGRNHDSCRVKFNRILKHFLEVTSLGSASEELPVLCTPCCHTKDGRVKLWPKDFGISLFCALNAYPWRADHAIPRNKEERIKQISSSRQGLCHQCNAPL